MSSDRVEELQKQIEDLLSRIPAHSMKPAMLQRLDELEEELEQAIEETKEDHAETDGRAGLREV